MCAISKKNDRIGNEPLAANDPEFHNLFLLAGNLEFEARKMEKARKDSMRGNIFRLNQLFNEVFEFSSLSLFFLGALTGGNCNQL